MTEQHNMTARQTGVDGRSKWACFLPAISSFYSTYIGRQRHENYVDATRMPAGIPEMEQLNFLNDQKGLFHYRWGLYSAGHADLDMTKIAPKEDMIRNRDPNTIILGDSGGFQIAKGVWEGDWKNPTDPKSSKRRETVLKWLDGIADYAMTLDVPTWIIHDPEASRKTGISTYQEAVDTTQYNNEYFIANRKGWQNGGTKFLNVMQGSNHAESDNWYALMKKYCDPQVYPDRHFNGWAFGGQNMCDVHLILKRIVIMIHDGLLEEGVHDWIHVLGTSKLEWALVLSDIQRAVRKYHNPALTISFDCASPFLATANGQIYVDTETPHEGKWTYRMEPTADNKAYAADQRSFRDAVLQDGIHRRFMDSPVSKNLTISDVCYYAPGALNKLGKEGKTSWDSFSYALMMGHNVWMHINAVQHANERYDAGEYPGMLVDDTFTKLEFGDLVDQIFAQNDCEKSLELIEYYSRFWTNIVGTRGFTGKRAINAHTQFNALFEIEEEPPANDNGLDETLLDQLEGEVE